MTGVLGRLTSVCEQPGHVERLGHHRDTTVRVSRPLGLFAIVVELDAVPVWMVANIEKTL
jgi:hypothetical protein